MRFKGLVLSSATVAVLGFGAVAGFVEPAAARVVCNSYGDCWHTDAKYNYSKYDREQRPQYHNDDWYFHQNWQNNQTQHYRDPHDGRGYYKNGLWITF